MGINLEPSKYHKINNFGFEQIISKKEGDKEKTYLTLKKRDDHVVSISAKILQGRSGLWERFKNFFTGRYIERRFVDEEGKNYDVFLKINDIVKRSYLTKDEKIDLRHYLGTNPKDLESTLATYGGGGLVDILQSIKEKYQKEYYITKIIKFSSLAEGPTNKFNFKNSFAKEILTLNENKEFKNFNVDPPEINIAYGTEKTATGVLAPDGRKAFTLTDLISSGTVAHPTYLNVNVWYDDREDACYLLIKKDIKITSEDIPNSGELNKLLKQVLGIPTNIS